MCCLPADGVPVQTIPAEQVPEMAIPQDANGPIDNPFGAHLIQPSEENPAGLKADPIEPSETETPLPSGAESQSAPESTSSNASKVPVQNEVHEISGLAQDERPQPLAVANKTKGLTEQSKLRIVPHPQKSVPKQGLAPGPRISGHKGSQAGPDLPSSSSTWKIAKDPSENTALFLDIASVLDVPQKAEHAHVVHHLGGTPQDGQLNKGEAEANQPKTTIIIASSEPDGSPQHVIPVQFTRPSIGIKDGDRVEKNKSASNSSFVKALLKHATPSGPAPSMDASQPTTLPGIGGGARGK